MPDFLSLVQDALAKLEAERPAEAEASIRAALEISPRDDQLFHMLGVALLRQERGEEAIEPLQKAISMSKRKPDYHNALGCALRDAGRFQEAVASLERALKLAPGMAQARYNLGVTYMAMGDVKRARQELRSVFEADRSDVEIAAMLSTLEWFAGNYDAAIACMRQALEANPTSGQVRFGLAERLLALGQFEEGWFRYLWRMNRYKFLERVGAAFNDPALMEHFPESLEGRTVKVHGEQGIGDDLFFLRFVRFLKERGARVEAAIEPRLVDMVRRSGALDACEPADRRSPGRLEYRMLGDLPYLLAAQELPLPPSLRFEPLPARVQEIGGKLEGLARPLVGLTWRAGTATKGRHMNVLEKNAPLEEFVAVARALPGTLVVLQREPEAGEVEKLRDACGDRVADFSALNADLEGMLALLAAIDEYIGVSNTNMHLCAALGRGARVLVTRAVEFRWMAEGPGSPWFPGFPVYRRAAGGDWSAAFRAVVEDIRAGLASRAAGSSPMR
jgi:Flp pilus assembly protein TadD